MKQLIALAALPLMAAPAMAGPYVNVEANAGIVGSDYTGAVIDTHIGYEGDLSETVSAYIQAGPALRLPEGGDSGVDVSGKAGLSVAATDALNIYGEYSFITGDELSSGIKAGVKYNF